MGNAILTHETFSYFHHAIVDAVWRSELPAHWPVQVLAPGFLGDDTERCPVLLDLAALPARDQGELWDLMSAQIPQRQDGVCSVLLASDKPLDALARHLTNRLTLSLDARSVPKQFRFFDPGIFLQLPDLLGEAGMKWLLGPVQSVLVPWAGHWTRLDTPITQPLTKLTTDHHARLLRIGAVNRVAGALPPPENTAQWQARCAALHQHAERAQTQHGLTSQSDLIAFCKDALIHRANFDTHPKIVELFQTLASAPPEDELDYRELSAQLTDNDWRAIVQDLSARPHAPET